MKDATSEDTPILTVNERQYIKESIESLHTGVVEIRGLRGRQTASGYYTDYAQMAADALRLEKAGYAVYFTINEVNPALLARSANRTKENPKSTTSDNDITRRLYFYVDCDPNRPADISSSDKEKDAAVSRAYEIRDYLRGLGYPDPVIADSGNGAHLLYRVDLPKDSDLVQRVLEGLAFQFSDEKVSIDTSVYNPARICKLYGTIANKGDSTDDRPHRRSGLIEVPDAIHPVGVDLLETVAEPKVEPREGSVKLSQKFNIPAFLERHSIGVVREGQWRDGDRWVLEECPWNGHTDNSAYIVQFGNGAIGAGCQHDSCQGKGWRELREHYEPDAYDPL